MSFRVEKYPPRFNKIVTGKSAFTRREHKVLNFEVYFEHMNNEMKVLLQNVHD